MKKQTDGKRAQVSKYEQVPLHRAYGVTKRETWLTRFNDLFASGLALALIALLSLTFFMGAAWLIIMLGHIGILLVAVGAVLFIYLQVLRKPRKRIKFLFKLKKRCRQLGYKIEFKRNFFKGLFFNTDGIDLVVDTRKKRWLVRFMTPPRYLCHITFIDKNTIEIKKNITTSRLKFVLGLDNVKVKRIPYSFADTDESGTKRVARALILNPVPHDAFKKDSDGATIPIGTGEYLYGYTVFSGSGFIQTITREDE